ncbi:hypothetical protein NEIRO02_1604 [Nematocida sp. AWRm79]|nr:hypothetical protein NEIRO02_1604 [Nematocida sp. AWRm79]
MTKEERIRISGFIAVLMILVIEMLCFITESDGINAHTYWMNKSELTEKAIMRRIEYYNRLKKELLRQEAEYFFCKIETNLKFIEYRIANIKEIVKAIHITNEQIKEITNRRDQDIAIDDRVTAIEISLSMIDKKAVELFYIFETILFWINTIDTDILKIIELHYTKEERFDSIKNSLIWKLSVLNKPVAVEMTILLFLSKIEGTSDFKGDTTKIVKDIREIVHVTEYAPVVEYLNIINALVSTYNYDIIAAGSVGLDYLAKESAWHVNISEKGISLGEVYVKIMKLFRREISWGSISLMDLTPKSIINLIGFEYFISGDIINQKRNDFFKSLEFLIRNIEKVSYDPKLKLPVSLEGCRNMYIDLFKSLWEVSENAVHKISDVSHKCSNLGIDLYLFRMLRRNFISCKWMYSLDFSSIKINEPNQLSNTWSAMIDLSYLHPLWYVCLASKIHKTPLDTDKPHPQNSLKRIVSLLEEKEFIIYPGQIYKNDPSGYIQIMKSCIGVWFSTNITILIGNLTEPPEVDVLLNEFIKYLSPGRNIFTTLS